MRIFTFIILLFSFSFAKAQKDVATPNAGFEYWTHFAAGYDDPDSLACLNPFTSGLGLFTCLKDSMHVHSGKYAIRLITMNYQNVEMIPGTVTTGVIDPSTAQIVGGIPFSIRPDSIYGWYEYVSASNDYASIAFYLFGANHSDTIGQGIFLTPKSNVSTYTRFSVPVTYRSGSPADTSCWIINSSVNQAEAKQGSQLYVDDIGLYYPKGAGVKNLINSGKVFVGPTLSNGSISVNNTSETSIFFNVLDMTGRKIQDFKLNKGISYLNLNSLPDGVYLYTAYDGQNSIIGSGKLVIQK